MPRRGGKAANRRDRQRKAQQRRQQQRLAAQPRPISGVVSEAVDSIAEERIEAAPARPSQPSPGPRAGRADPRFAVAGPSRLSERAAAEYHYVIRDLRNIGVLVVAMAVLLGGAVVAFSALKIGPT
jgi:hypothetical protein